MNRAALVLALLLAPTAAEAQDSSAASLRVTVVDSVTSRPIAGAQVGFPDLKRFTLTDADGNGVLSDIRPGDHQLEVIMLGYGRATTYIHLGPGAAGTGTVRLTAKAIAIDGITVEVRPIFSEWLDRRGFYGRAKTHLGVHFDEQDFDSLRANTLGELLRLHMNDCSGGSLTLGGGGRRLFLDGLPLERPEDVFAGVRRGGLAAVDLRFFEGVEVFNGPEVPGEYGGLGTDCGVILLWSK